MANALTSDFVSRADYDALRLQHAAQGKQLEAANARIAELIAEVGRLADLVLCRNSAYRETRGPDRSSMLKPRSRTTVLHGVGARVAS